MIVAINIRIPGNPERNADADLFFDPRNHQCREERSEVDDEVKRLEDFVDEFPVTLAKLVSDMSRNTRFNSARPDRDQPQPEPHSADGIFANSKDEVAEAVDQRQPDDRVIFAKQPVGDDGSNHRKRVHTCDKQVDHFLGILGANLLVHARSDEQRRQVDLQNRLHPVKAEAFAAFVPDDVFNAFGPAGFVRVRSRQIFRHECCSARIRILRGKERIQ